MGRSETRLKGVVVLRIFLLTSIWEEQSKKSFVREDCLEVLFVWLTIARWFV